MFKKIMYCFYLSLLFVSNFVYAQTATTVDYTYVHVTNNTNENLQLNTSLITADKDFTKGRDWQGSSLMLAPYETKEVLWFSRNINVKKNELYKFNVNVNHPDYSSLPIQLSLSEKGKSVYGSEISTALEFPNHPKQTILTKDGLEQFTGEFWNKNYILYARSWLPLGKVNSSYHLVIDHPQNNSFNTTDKNKLSVLTYNTQLMPFYAGVIDDLNQPSIRAKDIAKKIKDYDVVILQELLDRDLRISTIIGMESAYPYHTKVVGHDTMKVLTGGVVIFSKWPIINEDQIVFKAGYGLDVLAAKGAVYAAINKNGKIYHIVGAHLQSDNKDVHVLARQKQLQELSQFVDRLGVPTDQPVLIGGDFNIDEFSKELDSMLGILKVNLVNNIGYRYSFDATIDTMTVEKSRQRLDYVLASQLYARPKSALNKVFILRDLDNEKMWPKFDLSDHFPVASYFEF